MFSKKQRYSFKKGLPGKVISSPNFTLRYDKNDGEGLKTAVVVSKKVDKRAVVRNKLKRKVVELLKLDKLEDNNLNLVFYMKKSALDNEDLAKNIEEALFKIK